MARKLLTHCRKGHEFTEENTYVFYNKKLDLYTRICRKCRNGRVRKWELENSELHGQKSREYAKNYWHENKEKVMERERKNPHRNPLRSRKYRYKITNDEFMEMWEKQNKECKICGTLLDSFPKVAIDHCHKTGKIRGFLCKKYNTGLGMFQDNIEILIKAAAYLAQNHEEKEICPVNSAEPLRTF